MKLIIKIVAERTGVLYEQIASSYRSKEAVTARRLCAVMMRKYTLLTLQEIASELHQNNHTTIMYYMTTHENYMLYDNKYRRMYESIESAYKAIKNTDHNVIGYTLSDNGNLHGFFVHYESAHSNAHGRTVVPILSLNPNI